MINLTQDNKPPFCHLDSEKITSALVTLVMISAQLGHERPAFTVRDYLQRESLDDRPETQFVMDCLTLTTEEICDRWLGGEAHAAHSLMSLGLPES